MTVGNHEENRAIKITETISSPTERCVLRRKYRIATVDLFLNPRGGYCNCRCHLTHPATKRPKAIRRPTLWGRPTPLLPWSFEKLIPQSPPSPPPQPLTGGDDTVRICFGSSFLISRRRPISARIVITVRDICDESCFSNAP